MKYDYYKYIVHDETWHLVRVSTNLALAIVLEKAFADDIINENGPGTVVPVSKNSYGEYVGHIPLPTILPNVNDEFNWEARVWGNNTIELDHVKTLLYRSFWKRIAHDGTVLTFKFADFLYVNNEPLDVSYDIIKDEEGIWIISGKTKYKIIDINQNHMTLHDGRFVFIVTKES